MVQMGHPTDKIELIVMGGTFLAYSETYQRQFVKDCYDALNGDDSSPSGDLEEAKRRNETARHRCVGLCIETRPDWCGTAEVARMIEFGVTRVELGVQMLDDGIYKLIRRGHTVGDVVRATRLLKEHGFKVHYHWMPGLPGSDPEKDLNLSRRLFGDPRFRPDGLKLYPTMVVSGTELEKWYDDGRYQPYDDVTMTRLIANIKSIVPGYVRISRVLRDIPGKFIVGGLKDSMRDIVKQLMKEAGIECQCIRCREYGHRLRNGGRVKEPGLVRLDYDASEGKEVLLSFEDDRGTLFGLIRLRVQTKSIAGLGLEGRGKLALIRELHVYGAEVPLNEQNPRAAQHKGLGKALMMEAERLARDEFQASMLCVLSGVGAREYYRTEFGYTDRAGYMVKKL